MEGQGDDGVDGDPVGDSPHSVGDSLAENDLSAGRDGSDGAVVGRGKGAQHSPPPPRLEREDS